MNNYITPEGFEKLKKELHHLKTVKRKEAADLLSHAASFGDLSENAAYEEAKEIKSFLEGKILELDEMVKNAKILKTAPKTGWAQVGSKVSVDFNGEKMEFDIVGSIEADPLEGKISADSPLGLALMNHIAGDVITVETPGGIVKYKVLKVE